MARSGWVLGVGVLWVGLAATAIGCGDDDGGGGASGVNASGDGGASGSAGSGGAGGAGGSGGSGGSGGTAGDEPDAGDSGTGGTGGSGGTGGAGACATDCADNNPCTTDTCENGSCVNALNPSACAEGQSCHPTNGCVAGTACTDVDDCDDTDGCTANERCDDALAVCQWDPLDGDGDGFAPVSCGGADCNDADDGVRPGVNDGCNGVDNDCDGTIDEDASCNNGGTCVEGACVCGELTSCGQGPLATCVDLDTNADHCGECGNDCGAGTCVDGDCTCASPGAECLVGGPGGGMQCVNTDTSRQHCGGCDMACTGDEFCNGGDCEACGAAGQPCCPFGTSGGGLSSDGCPGAALICTGERGTPASVCGCPSPNVMCGDADACVNTQNDRAHCGTCGNACDTGGSPLSVSDLCVAGTCRDECTASNQQDCVVCGQEVGQPCCVRAIAQTAFYTCPADAVSCDQQTRLCAAAAN